MRARAALFLSGMTFIHAAPALAQSAAAGPSLTVEVASEERRRGLSWSDATPVARADASLPVLGGLSFDASAVALWGSQRHDDADSVIDLGVAYRQQSGGWQLGARGDYHLFPGSSDQGYMELGADAALLIGPANLEFFARYAPDQSSIGGDNLYLGTGLTIGVPATPFTLSAHIGRSSGNTDDVLRARRLRPDGTYWNHGVALDYHSGFWFAGVRYANSTVDRDRANPFTRHTGSAVIARVGLGF